MRLKGMTSMNTTLLSFGKTTVSQGERMPHRSVNQKAFIGSAYFAFWKRSGHAVFLKGLLSLAVTCLFSTALFAQSAVFTGHVTDQTGAIISKAQITVHNEETGVNVKTTTTESGDYTIPYLKPGVYSVTAEAAGFTEENKVHITLQVSQVAVIDFKLSVGSVSQSVTVQGEALLDVETADRGEVIGNERVAELPLNGRTPMTLDKLDAAVIVIGNIKYQRPFDGTIIRNVRINGGKPGSNEVLLDGVSNETSQPQNTAHNDQSYVATDDATQEFKIITNPYDAEYGRTLGGVIDMTLKSGTNRLHGDIYEFARRSWLDSNFWLNDHIIATNPRLAPKYQRPQHSLDQYGAELDGPVILPKVYNGRDKSFFVLQYENWHEILPATITTTVPDPAWSTGDFSGLVYYAGSAGYQPITIYDPLTLHPDSTGKLIRNPFQGNKIPQGRLNSTALKLLSYYPKPNATPLPGTDPWRNNFYAQNPTLNRYRNVLAKWDENLSANDRFWIRYGYWERYETDSINGIPGPAAYGEYNLGDRSNSVAAEWTRTVTPNLVADIRADITVKSEIADTGPQGFNPTSLGWPGPLVSQFGTGSNIFPGISPTDFANLGLTTANGLTYTDSLSLFPSTTWVRGKHTFHTGIDWRFYRYNIVQNPSGPTLSFNYTWTQNCWSCASGKDYSGADQNEGNSIASMLLGTAFSGEVSINSKAYYTTSYYAPFLEDDWKVTPKLVLNFGLRYDLAPYYVERHDRANYAFNTTDANPANVMLPFHQLANGTNVNLVGGVTFAGVNGNPRQAYSMNKFDIQPRVGFAYSLTNRTVLRGGFGEFFLPPNDYPTQNGFNATTTYSGSPDGGQTPIDNLSNPFPTVVQPAGASLGLLTNLGNAQSYLNPKFRIANALQFSFGFEEQLSSNDTLEMSYSGMHAPNNATSQDINSVSATAEAACNIQLGGSHHICDDNYAKNAKAIYGYVANPFYQVPAFSGSATYSQSTTQALNFTKPMPEFGAVTENLWNGARSWYNSLQVTAMHKSGKFLTVHATWNWSKLMDAGGYADNTYLIPSRTIDGNDVTHNITVSGVYFLPMGRGRAIMSNSNRIVEAALGGWEFGETSFIQSGFPWPAPGGYDYVHDAKLPHPYHVPSGNIQWFAPCVWTTDGETGAVSESSIASSFGCTQPDFIQTPSYAANPNVVFTGIRQPIGIFLDTDLAKNFAVWESLKLQLRLEAFNVPNHPLFQNGFISTLNSQFGQIGSATGGGQSNQPRQVQIAVKLQW